MSTLLWYNFLKEDLASIKEEQAATRQDIRQLQVAALELLEGQKELTKGQEEITRKVDMLAEMFGRHDVDIRLLKKTVGIRY
ncbi:MAG: hypothetical protein K6T29_03630 [Peptococcaceae bacterium]|nr:hypothetical protein [Peptococcaceae bacterium]